MTSATYCVHPTPVGDAVLLFTDSGLAALQLVHGRLGDELEGFARQLGHLPAMDEARDDGVRSELDAYFAGSLKAFDVELDWRFTRGFTTAALKAVREIPYGETASYGEVAAVAGSPRASRAVGSACRLTPFSLVVPVHRVIRSDGSLGEFGGHPEVKRYLIELEKRVGG